MRKVTKSSNNKLDTIGKRIEYLRRNIGLSQEELAEKLEIKRVKLSYIESDVPDRQLTTNELSRLADIFNVSTDYILGRSPAKNSNHYELSNSFSEESINKIEKLSKNNNNIINTFLENTDTDIFWKPFEEYVIISNAITELSKISKITINNTKSGVTKYLKSCINTMIHLRLPSKNNYLNFDTEANLVVLIDIMETLLSNLKSIDNDEITSELLYKGLKTNLNNYYIKEQPILGLQTIVNSYLDKILNPLCNIAELHEYKITKYINYIFQKLNPSMKKDNYELLEAIINKL